MYHGNKQYQAVDEYLKRIIKDLTKTISSLKREVKKTNSFRREEQIAWQ